MLGQSLDLSVTWIYASYSQVSIVISFQHTQHEIAGVWKAGLSSFVTTAQTSTNSTKSALSTLFLSWPYHLGTFSSPSLCCSLVWSQTTPLCLQEGSSCALSAQICIQQRQIPVLEEKDIKCKLSPSPWDFPCPLKGWHHPAESNPSHAFREAWFIFSSHLLTH